MRDMVVGYQSAIDFWRSVRVATGERLGSEEGGKIFGARPLTLNEQVGRALTLCNTELPLDVVVTSARARRHSESVDNHVWRAPLGDERLVPLGSDIKVCTMPAVFTQLGTELDKIDLALIGYEMTGTYGLTPWARDTMASDLAELVSMSELRGYVEAACALKVRGAVAARSALNLVVAGSNSPRESEIGVFLTILRREGGADLGGFSMNKPIPLPAGLAEAIGQRTVVPDFIWPNGSVVEYDSDQEHNTPDARARDERKRRAYQKVGMDCLTLTNGILRSNELLDAFIEDLELSLGKRRRPLTERQQQARKDLRERLFGPETVRAALAELNQAPLS